MQIHIIFIILVLLYVTAYNKLGTMISLASFVKQKRKEAELSQEAFAVRAGVALTVIRKIEQGKENLNLEKVNHVLKMFGHELAPADSKELIPPDKDPTA